MPAAANTTGLGCHLDDQTDPDPRWSNQSGVKSYAYLRQLVQHLKSRQPWILHVARVLHGARRVQQRPRLSAMPVLAEHYLPARARHQGITAPGFTVWASPYAILNRIATASTTGWYQLRLAACGSRLSPRGPPIWTSSRSKTRWAPRKLVCRRSADTRKRQCRLGAPGTQLLTNVELFEVWPAVSARYMSRPTPRPFPDQGPA